MFFQRKAFQRATNRGLQRKFSLLRDCSFLRNWGEPITYVLHDKKGEEILGGFHYAELAAFKYAFKHAAGK